MAYKPTNTLPITGPNDPNEPYPSQMQIPIQMRRSIDASQNWFDNTQNADAVGDAIVDYYSATIGNFVNTQRRDYGAGVAQVHSKFLNMPGLTIQYENRQGLERLSLTCYPESFTGGGNDELNMDGYFLVWCTGWDPGTPPPGAQQVTVDILVNGTSVGEATFTSNVQSAVVVTFGQTALKCESLADEIHGGPGNPNKPLVNRCEPPRKETYLYYNKGNSEQFSYGVPGGYPVPKHADVFGYFLYNWNNPYNQGMGGNAPYFQTPGGYLNPGGGEYKPAGPAIALDPLTKIVGDPKLIKNGGLNEFRVQLSTPWVALPTDSCTFVLQAEFYSRQDIRPVTQSWTQQAGPNGAINVNDKPLCFSTLCSIAKMMPLNVDFTPQKTAAPVNPPTPTPNGAFNGQSTAIDGKPPFNNGYFRFGDGWSAYDGQPSNPWGEVSVLVSEFSAALTTMKQFMTNQFTPSIPPTTIPIFDPPYYDTWTYTNQFFGNGAGAPMTSGAPIAEGTGGVAGGGEVDASYETVYNLVVSLEATWSSNLAIATSKATTQDIFLADSGALTMLNSLINDGNNFMQTVFGSTNPNTAIPNPAPTIPSYAGGGQFTPNYYNWSDTVVSPFYCWQYMEYLLGINGFVIENPDDPNPNATFLGPQPYTNAIFGGGEDAPGGQAAQLAAGWGLTEQFCGAIASPWSQALVYQPSLAALLNSMTNYKIPST